MARLSGDVITYVVTRLACYDRPVAIQTDVRTTFGIEMSLPQILYYDPEHSPKLAKKWQRYHGKVRERFLNDTSSIPIAQKAYRLRTLQRLLEKDEVRGATALAGQHIRQAAEEMGGKFITMRVVGDPADELSKLLGIARDDLVGALAGA